MEKLPPPIIVEATYPASIEKVWAAITELDQMRKWFFENIEDFQPKVGFETKFAIHHEGKTFTHQWKIREVIPYQRISYNWNYEEYDGDGYITFDLEKKDAGTLLRLTDILTAEYPSDIPEFKRESGVDGWNYFLNQQLKDFLTHIS